MIAERRIGRLSLPELGFGAAPLGNLYRAISDAIAAETLAAALDAGLSYVDTAPYYGFGLSETRVGAAIRGRSGVRVSTKVGRLLEPVAGELPPERHGFHAREPFAPVFDYSHDGVLRSYEESLARLGRIDILYVHDIGRLTHGEGHAARLAELLEGGGLRALERLRDEGAIGAFGIGVNETEVALELLDRTALDVILLAGRYTLLEQGALDALLPRCAAAGTAVVIGGPYNSGILTGGSAYDYVPAPPDIAQRVRSIAAICAQHDVPIGTAALRFVLEHPAVVSVVPGLASPAEVKDTLARHAAAIPHALWDALKAAGLLRADAPTPSKERTLA